MDDTAFLKQIENDFKEVYNARKVIGEWEFEIEGIPEPVRIKAFVDSEGLYWAVPNILIDDYLPEGRAMKSPELAVSTCLFWLITKLKTSTK